MLAYFRGTEVHNELLHDTSMVFPERIFYPESDHAPVIAHFELPEKRIKRHTEDGEDAEMLVYQERAVQELVRQA